ncbi:hypothetical protein SNEBB_001233 [Seison nebaliae]|nr:hypothetical protein SNEBB_001233 [Seison nebaliae]
MNYFIIIYFLLYGKIFSGSQPNIIYILVDDWGYADVGYQNVTHVKTPIIDLLAKDGIRLNRFYVHQMCTPSRAALMTGKYSMHVGMQHFVILADGPWGLDPKEKILPEYLNELNYKSYGIGKWHLGFFKKEFLPMNRGFHHYFGYMTGSEDYWDHTQGDNPKEWGFDLINGTEFCQRNNFGIYSTDLFMQEISRVIDQHDKTKPMFLYLPLQSVHSGNSWKTQQVPWQYEKKFQHIKNEDRRKYSGMVNALDDMIGDILLKLDESKILQNSIIVLTTDNGGGLIDIDGTASSNWPLRGAKRTAWEGGTRGLGLIWSSLFSNRNRGKELNEYVHITDWLPTFYSAAGGRMGNLSSNVDGKNLWPSLKKFSKNNFRGSWPRYDIVHNMDNGTTWTYSFRNWKLHINITDEKLNGWFPPNENYSSIDSSSSNLDDNLIHYKYEKIFKILKKGNKFLESNSFPSYRSIDCGPKPKNYLTNCQPNKSPCLHNIATDPCEYRNIAKKYPRIVKWLVKKMEKISRTIVKRKNRPSDSKANPKYYENCCYNHTKCLLTFFGTLLIFSTHGLNYCWDNLNVYLTSYLRQHCDHNIRYGDTFWAKTINPFGQALGALLGGVLQRYFQAQKTLFVGCTIYSLCIFLSYFAIQASLFAFVMTYGFLFGVGSGIVYGVALQNITEWLINYKGIFLGLASSGFAIAGILFNKMIVYYINPDNKVPQDADENGKNETYFVDEKLLSKVPQLLLILGTLFSGIQIIGVLCTINSPDSSETNTTGKDNFEIKHFYHDYEHKRNFVLFPIITCFHLFAFYVFMSIYKNFAFKFIPDDNFLGTVTTIGSVGNLLRFIPISYIDYFKFKTNVLFNLTVAIVITSLMPLTPYCSKWLYSVFIFIFYNFMSSIYPGLFLGICELFGVQNGSLMVGVFTTVWVVLIPLLTLSVKPLFDYAFICCLCLKQPSDLKTCDTNVTTIVPIDDYDDNGSAQPDEDGSGWENNRNLLPQSEKIY